ncbi:unannotated protein [freshwater metagenome]|uniref:Unannotated protein n=1 Tax=freshwater metagenome TaxID=449393 RepID=A0A6J6DVA9_9ZZZZ
MEMRLRRARVGGELGQGISRTRYERGQRFRILVAGRCLHPAHHINPPRTNSLDRFSRIGWVQATGEDHPTTLRKIGDPGPVEGLARAWRG